MNYILNFQQIKKFTFMKLFPTDLMNLGIKKKFKDGLYLQTPKNMYYKYIKCF